MANVALTSSQTFSGQTIDAGQHANLKLPNGSVVGMCPTEMLRTLLGRLRTRLQQGFTTGGMGSDRYFAWQQSSGPNVRFVPQADIMQRSRE